MQSQG